MITAFIRTLILYLLITFCLRLTGKRQIGELEPSELVLTMMISDLATVPMQDFGIPLLCGVIPILTLVAMSMLFSQLSLKSLRFRAMSCGTPTLLINQGRLCQDAMRRNRFTIDELYEELRSQGYCDPQSVKYAVLENSGQVSILPWPAEQPPTAKQLGREVEDDTVLPVILVNDGRTVEKNLQKCGKAENWLRSQIAAQGFSGPEEVFLFTYTEPDQVLCIGKKGDSK